MREKSVAVDNVGVNDNDNVGVGVAFSTSV